jgi:uncharacterized glyoxalase superfamily protein PhnB
MRQSHGIVARAPGDCIGHLSARTACQRLSTTGLSTCIPTEVHPTSNGARRYIVLDPEGHLWHFANHGSGEYWEA